MIEGELKKQIQTLLIKTWVNPEKDQCGFKVNTLDINKLNNIVDEVAKDFPNSNDTKYWLTLTRADTWSCVESKEFLSEKFVNDLNNWFKWCFGES